MSQPPLLIDLRPQARLRETGTARGALALSGTEVLIFAQTGELQDMLKGRPLALMCDDGSLSAMVAEALALHGLRNVTVIGSMEAWVHQGGAVAAFPARDLPAALPAPRPVGEIRWA